MVTTTIRLAIISDIHAASIGREHAPGTYITVPPTSGRSNPLDDFRSQVCKELVGKIDYLICPGDIANQADSDAFKWMWGELRQLQRTLGAHEILATCGNHDLDSRYLTSRTDDPDAKGALLALEDPFPQLAPSELNHYWARNYVIVDKSAPKPHRILLLNTCAYHGTLEDEIKHGRISARTIDAVTKDLAGMPAVGLNLLVCHHHLAPLPSWDAGPDYQYVRKGGELLRRLEDSNTGPWMVIHGHRHWPDCIYSAGGAGSPVIFCSASFGKADAMVSNQFHVVEVEIDDSASRPKGVINTWTWTLATGWARAEAAAGSRALSFSNGFGFGGSLKNLANLIDSRLVTADFMDWSDALTLFPDINYILPSDFKTLIALLKGMNIRVHFEDGEPYQIAKRAVK